MLFALAIFGYFTSKRRIQELKIHQEFSNRFAIGEKTTVYLVVENDSDRNFFLHIKDEYPPQMQLIGEREVKLRLGSHRYARINYDLIPPKRGQYEFGATVVRFLSKFGLVWCQTSINTQEFVKVYPNI